MDKANRINSFKITFLVANISPKVVFGIPFFTLSIDVDFSGQELQQKIYTIKEAFLTTRCVELVGKKEFSAATLDLESEIFIVYIASLSSVTSSNSSPLKLNIYPSRKP